jgi:hypothetical protein
LKNESFFENMNSKEIDEYSFLLDLVPKIVEDDLAKSPKEQLDITNSEAFSDPSDCIQYSRRGNLEKPCALEKYTKEHE